MTTPNQFAILLKKWQEGTISGSEMDQLLSAWESGEFTEWTGEIIEGDLQSDRWLNSVSVSGK